jgi:hypothetical protein
MSDQLVDTNTVVDLTGTSGRGKYQRVTVSVPTFEPNYAGNSDLEAYYAANFDSWLAPDGPFDLTLVLSDFRSSDTYKAFLRRFAAERPGQVVVIDGATTNLNSVAANLGFRLMPYDIAVWAASDTRARDPAWLQLLTEDFDDPGILSAYATSPIDASYLVDQLQPGPIDSDSRKLRFPESPIPNVVAFKKALLGPYDDRMTDISAYNVSEASVWQLEAVGGQAVVSFRCNVLHDHFFGGGRYFRQSDDNWMTALRTKETQAFRTIHRFLSVPETMLNPLRGRPILRPLLDGLRQGGLRGLARNAYIRSLQSQASFVYHAIRKKGLLGYLLQYQISRRQHEAFCSLPEHARCAIIRGLFFKDLETYANLSYSVHGAPARLAPADLPI